MPTSAPLEPVTAPPLAPPNSGASPDAPSGSLASSGAVLTCTSCGGDNALDSRFCRHCGAALRAGASSGENGGATPSNGTPSNGVLPANTVSTNGNGSSASGSPAPSVQELPAETPAPISALKSELPAAASAAPTDTAIHSTPDETNGVAHSDTEAGTNEVDRNRARSLLDRASRLSERGELPAAILACRQAVALSPQSVGGFALLGALSERAGDTNGAINAYEHVLALWPDSPLERERLRVLRTGQSQMNTAAVFHFDDNELFPTSPITVEAPTPAEATPAPSATETLVTVPPVAATAGAASDASTIPVPPTVATVSGVTAVGATAAPTASVAVSPPALSPSLAAVSSPPAQGVPAVNGINSAPPAPALGANAASLPSAPPLTPARVPLSGGVPSIAPLGSVMQSTAGAPSIAPLSPSPEQLTVVREASSFFWRGAPLAATVGTGLIFMLWAANWSAGRQVETQTPVAQTPVTVAANPTPAVSGPARLVEGVPGGGVSQIPPGSAVTTNQPQSGGTAPTTPVGSSGSTNTAPSSAAPRVGVVPTPAGGSRAPRQGGNPTRTNSNTNPGIAPAPVPTSAVLPPSAPQGSQPSIPAPRLPGQSPTPISVAPDDSGASSSGASTKGAPLNPDGSSGSGYIRLHNGPASPASLPVRPSSQANSSERAASAAARTGQPDRAVADVSDAIRKTNPGDRDLAFRYQTRAMLFLEQGDNPRAIDDFNSAIAAYQDQIGRNVEVDAARSGIAACRRGLRLAQNRLGR